MLFIYLIFINDCAVHSFYSSVTLQNRTLMGDQSTAAITYKSEGNAAYGRGTCYILIFKLLAWFSSLDRNTDKTMPQPVAMVHCRHDYFM